MLLLPSHASCDPQDIDDAFSRLIEAEEEEEAQEAKRKEKSSDLKDMLANRRKRPRLAESKHVAVGMVNSNEPSVVIADAEEDEDEGEVRCQRRDSGGSSCLTWLLHVAVG